jgi:hypothetical protein
MIAGLCESPLTFQAIIIWRDELNDRVPPLTVPNPDCLGSIHLTQRSASYTAAGLEAYSSTADQHR